MKDREVVTARDKHGKTIRVGDRVRYEQPYGDQDKASGVVTVVRMWRQGANGTRIETDPVPDPDYPYHKSCRASHCVKEPRTKG